MQTAVADYHMHSNVSPDGRAPMEDMCLAAIRQGLHEIVLTDHFEMFQPNIPANPYTYSYLENYFDKLNRCRAQYSSQLRIRAGVEMGQSYLDLELEQKILRNLPYDYVIGSVHKLQNIDVGEIDYHTVDLNVLCLDNLEKLYQLADQSDFDCMGHVDLIKRYAARSGIKVNLMDYREQVHRIFKRLIEREKGIEINTSGLRQAAKETLPSFELIRLFYSMGGRILTIGSDAHRPEDVGKGLAAALTIAKEAGFTRLALFENRQPRFLPIP